MPKESFQEFFKEKEKPYTHDDAWEEAMRLRETKYGKQGDYRTGEWEVEDDKYRSGREAFFSEWRKNTVEMYEQNSRIMDELVDGVEGQLKSGNIFDFTKPGFWSAFEKAELEQSQKIADKYSMQTNRIGTIGQKMEFNLALGQRAFSARLFAREFFAHLVGKELLSPVDKELFLGAMVSFGEKATGENLLNRLGANLLKHKIESIDRLSEKENMREIDAELSKRFQLFTSTVQVMSLGPEKSDESLLGNLLVRVPSGYNLEEVRRIALELKGYFDHMLVRAGGYTKGLDIGHDLGDFGHYFFPKELAGDDLKAAQNLGFTQRMKYSAQKLLYQIKDLTKKYPEDDFPKNLPEA